MVGQQAGSWLTSISLLLPCVSFMEPVLFGQLQLGLIGCINAEHEHFSVFLMHHEQSPGLTGPLLSLPWGEEE